MRSSVVDSARSACDWVSSVLLGADTSVDELRQRFDASFLERLPEEKLMALLGQLRFVSTGGSVTPPIVDETKAEFDVVNRLRVELTISGDEGNAIKGLVFKPIAATAESIEASAVAAAAWLERVWTGLESADAAEVGARFDPRVLQKVTATDLSCRLTPEIPPDGVVQREVSGSRVVIRIGEPPEAFVGVVDIDPRAPHLITGVVHRRAGEAARRIKSKPELRRTVSALDGEASARIQAVVDRIVAESCAPGVVLAIGRNGSIMHVDGIGEAWLGATTPPAEATPFRVCSVTKVAVALTAVRLSRQGLFDLDAPVTALLQSDLGWDASKAHPSMRHLLTHTGGLPRDLSASPLSFRDQIVNGVSRSALPGARELYSNVGYGIVGVALEDVSGRALADLLNETAPGTTVVDTEPSSPPAAVGYFVGAGIVAPAFETLESPAAAGGLVATASQLVTLGSVACDDPDLLSPHDLPTSFRCGMQHQAGADGDVYIQDGGRPGWRSALALDRESGFVVAVLANSDRLGLATHALLTLDELR